jgi:hypothetical protein
MKWYIFIFCVLFCLLSCKCAKVGYFKYRKESELVFTEKELNFLIVKKYLEQSVQSSNKDSIIIVNSVFRFFDQELFNNPFFFTKNSNAGIETTNTIDFRSFGGDRLKEDKGRFVFSDKDFQFEFAPAIYSPESKSLYCHVKHANGKAYRFVYRLIGDMVFDQGVYELISDVNSD